MTPTDLIDQDSLRTDIPDFRPGDTLKVHVRVVEGNKERIQIFQGEVIRRQGAGLQETYTVRKISSGVGVERTFPLHAPTVAKVEKVGLGKVRRAKLYYLRDRVGRAAKVKQRRMDGVMPGSVQKSVDAPVESPAEDVVALETDSSQD